MTALTILLTALVVLVFAVMVLLLRQSAELRAPRPQDTSLQILNQHVDARTALQESLDQYSALFAEIHDEYFRERMADVRDVIGRIASHLTRQETEHRFPEILPGRLGA